MIDEVAELRGLSDEAIEKTLANYDSNPEIAKTLDEIDDAAANADVGIGLGDDAGTCNCSSSTNSSESVPHLGVNDPDDGSDEFPSLSADDRRHNGHTGAGEDGDRR